MNSLTYLARQFDVLASPNNSAANTEASTSSFIQDTSDSDSASDQPPLKRVRTWSSRRAFLTSKERHKPPKRSHSQDSLYEAPKRTQSSPAEFDFLTIGNGPSRHTQRKKSFVITSLDSGSSILVRTKPTSPVTEFGPFTALRRIFAVRVIVVVWDALCKAWYKIRQDLRRAQKESNLEEGDTTEDSSAEPMSTLTSPLSTLRHVTLQRSHHDVPLPYAPSKESRQLPPPPPPPQPRRTPFHQLTKTLVLDLDETLIHSTTRTATYSSGSGGFFGLSVFGRSRRVTAEHTVEVYLGGKSTIYHVNKRPHVDYFLRKVSKWYRIVIFTASLQEYADPVIDWLDDGSGLIEDRFFRDSCTQLPDGSYSKDLTLIEPDLSRICLLDNSPVSYKINEANGIPVEGWTHDPSDEALLDLLPVLDSLRFTGDVRRVLGIRGYS